MSRPKPPRVFPALVSCAIAALACAPALAEPPVLRVSLESEPLTLDWQAARTPVDRFLVSFLMRGLLRYDEQAKPVCDLCRSYSVMPDGKTYRFELREDLAWSDGAPLEAEQFVLGFRRLVDPEQNLPDAEDYRVIAGARQSGRFDPRKLEVVAESPARLRITLTEPSAIFPHLLTRTAAFPIRKDHGKGVQVASPVLGAYQLAAWEKGKRIVVEGNPRYALPRPVYRVDFHLGAHADQVKRFRSGKLDILANPSMDDLLQIQGKNLQVSPYWATRMLVFNTSRPAASDAAVRRAVLYGVDRAKLPARLQSGERSATGVIPPGLPGHRQLPLATPDAQRALKERARDPRSEITLQLVAREGLQERKLVSWLEAEISPLKLRLQPRWLGPEAHLEALSRGDFDLALLTWSFTLATPLDLLRSFRTGAPRNLARWTSVAYDALLSQLIGQHAVPDYAQLTDEITRLIEVQEAVVLPLGYPTQPFLLGRRVKAFAVTPFGDPDLVKIKLLQ